MAAELTWSLQSRAVGARAAFSGGAVQRETGGIGPRGQVLTSAAPATVSGRSARTQVQTLPLSSTGHWASAFGNAAAWEGDEG